MHNTQVQAFGGRRILRAVFLAALLVLANFMTALPVFRDHLQTYLAINNEQYGLLFSVGPMVAAGSTLLCGTLIGRFGAELLVRWSLWGVAAGMVLTAASGRSWLMMLAGVTVYYVFVGPLGVAINVCLTDMFPENRRRALALGMTVLGAGSAIIPLYAEALLALPAYWPQISFATVLHGPFWILAALLLAASFLFRGRKNTASDDWSLLPDWRTFLMPPTVLWLILFSGMHGALDNSLNLWMPKFLSSAAFSGPAPISPGVVLAIFSLAYLFSRGILTLLPEAWGRRSLLVLPGVLGGGVMLLGLFSGSYAITAGAYVLAGLIWSCEYPAMLGMLAANGKYFASALALGQIANGILTSLLTFSIGHISAGSERMTPAMTLPAFGFILIGLGGFGWICRYIPRQNSGAKTKEEVPICQESV